MNNSKILYSRSTVEDATALILACKKTGCSMVVNSDTHAIQELGRDESVRPLLEHAAFPASLVINRNLDAAATFLAGRKGLKKEAFARHHR